MPFQHTSVDNKYVQNTAALLSSIQQACNITQLVFTTMLAEILLTLEVSALIPTVSVRALQNT
jgi:hypothetical protein